MRVLHIATRHRTGGAEKNVIHWIECQLEAGDEVEFAVGPDGLVMDLPPAVRVHQIGDLCRELRPLGDLRALLALRRTISRGRFDLVHTHQSKAGILGRIAAFRRAPLIVHSVHMASFGSAYSARASSLFLRLERLCARFTDRIVCVGNSLRVLYLGAGVGRDGQYEVLRSPIDVERFLALREAGDGRRQQDRDALGIAPETKVLLSLGALDQRKRHDSILRELRPLLAADSAILVIAGDGPERQALEELAHELGIEHSVRLEGFVGDIRPLLTVADALVHASEVEGVPQVAVQALAAGVPVVAATSDWISDLPVHPAGVAQADCSDLEAATQRVLALSPEPCPPEDLMPWQPDRVAEQIQRFNAQLEADLQHGPGSGSRAAARVEVTP